MPYKNTGNKRLKPNGYIKADIELIRVSTNEFSSTEGISKNPDYTIAPETVLMNEELTICIVLSSPYADVN